MFTVIGERINMTRTRIKERVLARDADYIAQEAMLQDQAGATHIDVNAGADPAREVDDMAWLTEVVSAATELPLAFDSTNAEALEAGLEICNRHGTLVNSITGETERLAAVLPLVTKFNAGVVALTMDDSGMPDGLDGRMAVTRTLAQAARQAGVALERVYFDPLVRPASTNPGQARVVLDAIVATRAELPDAHFALGLSNISFGLPSRNVVNRAFLAMLVAAGADGVILDPCEPGTMATLLAARAALGLDDFCMGYITAYRAGKLA